MDFLRTPRLKCGLFWVQGMRFVFDLFNSATSNTLIIYLSTQMLERVFFFFFISWPRLPIQVQSYSKYAEKIIRKVLHCIIGDWMLVSFVASRCQLDQNKIWIPFQNS